MTTTSSLRKAADAFVEGGLDLFVASRRATGTSWRGISRELAVTTNGVIDVSDQTLRRWFEIEQVAA